METSSSLDTDDERSLSDSSFPKESSNNARSIQDSLKAIQRKLESTKNFDEVVSAYEEGFALLNPALQALQQTRQEFKIIATDDNGLPLKDLDNTPILKDFAYEERLS
ncbi:hypothetical protein [Chlamydiifrater phoenicopteri]|uniref:hypothetical protein n=1 Tax=Chlamydiifrater phoenicopteri TaxID=2681469 RepID=UPI001BD07B72|nr:hypothetical protein [Chlamydiifrater phoenicopteri]